MKAYGMKKATEFTKKQVGVIYRNYKEGTLEMADNTMKEFYKLADFYGFDDNRNIERREHVIKNILNAIFENDIEKAQKNVCYYEECFA